MAEESAPVSNHAGSYGRPKACIVTFETKCFNEN